MVLVNFLALNVPITKSAFISQSFSLTRRSRKLVVMLMRQSILALTVVMLANRGSIGNELIDCAGEIIADSPRRAEQMRPMSVRVIMNLSYRHIAVSGSRGS